MVVTNDEMRDHHFQMLSHRSFLRWKERHCVRFRIGPQTAEVEAKSFVFFSIWCGGVWFAAVTPAKCYPSLIYRHMMLVL